jgi:hypothetical protein
LDAEEQWRRMEIIYGRASKLLENNAKTKNSNKTLMIYMIVTLSLRKYKHILFAYN